MHPTEELWGRRDGVILHKIILKTFLKFAIMQTSTTTTFGLLYVLFKKVTNGLININSRGRGVILQKQNEKENSKDDKNLKKNERLKYCNYNKKNIEFLYNTIITFFTLDHYTCIMKSLLFYHFNSTLSLSLFKVHSSKYYGIISNR